MTPSSTLRTRTAAIAVALVATTLGALILAQLALLSAFTDACEPEALPIRLVGAPAVLLFISGPLLVWILRKRPARLLIATATVVLIVAAFTGVVWTLLDPGACP